MIERFAPLFVGTDDGIKRCPRCRQEAPDRYNGGLAQAQTLGLYGGPVLGGFELCDHCDTELRTEESALARGRAAFPGPSRRTCQGRRGARSGDGPAPFNDPGRGFLQALRANEAREGMVAHDDDALPAVQ